MKKFEISWVIGIGLLASVGIGLLASEIIPNSFEEKPNFVLIMTDDVSVTMLNFLLEKNMMPNLNENFIEKGTTFTNSFVSSPLCCPSRATTFTGLYPHNHEIFHNTPKVIDGVKVVKGGFKDFNDNSTIAIWLQKEGYKTGFIGKYMNGYFGKTVYIPPGWDDWRSMSGASDRMLNFGMNDNGLLISIEDQYKTDYLADEASDFIINSKTPFFLFVSTLVAHSSKDGTSCEVTEGNTRSTILVSSKYKDSIKEFQFPYSPSFNETDVSDKFSLARVKPPITNSTCIESQFKDRVESLRSVDDLVGTITSALVSAKQLENTVMIFTSDNGYFFGEHRLFGKVIPYEESIRVPLFVRVPSFENQTVEQLVINNDLAPTIAELALLDLEFSTDGLSLVPLLNGTSSQLREDFLVEVYAGNGAFYYAIRGQDFLYMEKSGKVNFTEYYDLVKDPFQLTNLAECVDEECIKKLEKLDLRLDELKKCGNGTC